MRQALITPITAVLAVVALARAWTLRWTCDDAFVSFRYAANLVEGHGLVWNPGERVEGYTNLLWTLMIAPALAIGLDPIPVGHVLGLASFAWVGWSMWRLSSAGPPVALWAFLLCGEALVWATGGLETMTVAAFAVGMAERLFARERPRVFAAAVFGALLVLTRPDGALLVLGIGGGFALARGDSWTSRIRLALQSGGLALLATVGVTVFRTLYYGELLPNTYYAKSADLSWWDQGFTYVGLFLVGQHTILWLAAAGLMSALVGRDSVPATRTRTALVLGATAVVYTLYVARSGGDFMFARRLIPALPLALLALETPLLRLSRPALHWAAALIVTIAAVLPIPVFDWWGDDLAMIDGIVDESAVYTTEYIELRRAQGEALGDAMRGLEATFLLEGGLCMLAYYSRLPAMIEGVGLTDHTIARMPLSKRGRPGHEKAATDAYLNERGVEFVVLHDRPLRLAPTMLTVRGLTLHVRRYDRPLMDALSRRAGVTFTPIETIIQVVRARVSREPCELARHGVEFLESYYFSHNADPGSHASLIGLLESRCGR